MADFMDYEAEESEEEGSEVELEVAPATRRADKKKRILESDDDEDEDDGEEVKDLIDDNPIEEDSDNESERSRKRKKSDDEDDEDFDDRLEDEDYELLEENLGVKVQRKKFKRLRRIQEEDSDEETVQDTGDDREAIANQLFEGSDNEEERVTTREESTTQYASEESAGEYSETDDFIVDDEGRPLTEKRRKRKPIFTDSSLQEAQDIFGVDFDYDDFEKYDDEDYEEEEEEDEDYENEDEEQRSARLAKKPVRKGRKPKSIYEIYEPSELERAGFTDEDNLLRSQDIPERMQLRTVPIKPAADEELDEESDWIYEFAFRDHSKKAVTPGVPQLKQGKSVFDQDPTTSTVAGTSAVDDDWDNEIVAPTAKCSINGANTTQGDDDWDEPSVIPTTPAVSHVESRETVPSSESTTVPSNIIEESKPQTIPKIRKALDFMRNQHLEVPFISFYRKEYVEPELKINDLWTIYRMDARYCQLRSRKTRLSALYHNMQSYQSSLICKTPDDPIPDSIRLITQQDLDRVSSIRTHDELKDVYLQFSLYYSQDVLAMKEFLAEKKKRERADKTNASATDIPEDKETDVMDDDETKETTAPEIKRKPTGGPYALCRKFGLDALAKQFGLTPEKFAENLRDNYQRHEVEQYPIDPITACKEFVSPRLPSAEEVLKAAKFMVGIQISREPMVRKCVREVFFERATFDVAPTKKGLKEIDESHPVFTMKFIRGKPVRDLRGDTFLKLCIAEEDGLITLNIGETIRGITAANYVDEVKQLYYKDEFSKEVQDWNKLRGDCVEFALEVQLYPALRKELRAKLLEEAKQCVLKECADKVRSWIEVKPYKVSFPEEDDEEWDSSKGIKVLAIAFVPDFDQASFACLVSPDGDASDYLRLQNIIKSKVAFRESDRAEKEADLFAVKNFVKQKKPHVIVIGGECRDAQMIQEDIRSIMSELMAEESFPNINVEICDNEEAKVYASSLKASTDFREYPLLLRQAISLGRRMQDPLIEFSQLCTPDDEILCLRFHPLQDHVAKEELLEYIHLEFVNCTNKVGVDVNRAIAYPFTFNLVQFICGLGPRKAAALVKTLKQNNQRLENRTQLITVCHMGPKIFINCSGFIKIDTNSLGDSTEAYVEVLDGTRVHPETYEWARKMAVDALEYDDEDANPAGALEEILEAPERLRDLDLDAFADELERQGFGDKSITLYDIRNELNQRYDDQRTPYQSPNPEALFNMLTGETPETLYVGKLITATVVGISHKKPQGEQLDNAIPVRNEETGMWQCSFCLKNDFPDLSEVWNHFDANACPGQAIGIRLRLDNGIKGFIPIAKLSDKQVTNPENRVKRGQTIHCRISKVDVERFSVDCTSRTSDLADVRDEWRRPKDPYYDKEAEEAILKKDKESKKLKQRQTYVKRVIVHQAFRNISYREAEKLMEQMDQGEVVVRPSSKGADHLTVTWKVSDGVYQHIDVKEEKKENAFSLGQSLWIGNEEFEDLDEILARHINPMAAYARDMLNFKYYKALDNRIMAEEYLKKEREKSSNKIHYILFASKEFPGKFILSYLPKNKVYHEFITIRPEGFRFRQQNFDSLILLFKWFKEHYRDPQPSGTPVATPAVQHLRTPYTTPAYGANNDLISKSGVPTAHLGGMSHGLANTTPHYATPAQAYTPFSSFTSHTPYTPTAQTPYMTPFQTPVTTPKLSSSHATHGGQGAFTQPIATSVQRGAQQQRVRNTTTGPGNEALDWRKAAEAWAKSQQKSHSQPAHRSDASVVGQPMTRNAAQVIHEGIEKTKQMSSSAHNFLSQKSPKTGRDSLRSTPRTNFSPRSMVESSLGDETPLFDEN